MKSLTTKILKSCLMTGAVLLSLWGGAAFAESYDLVAGAADVTMPDGKVVRVWGYGKCTSGDLSFANCSTARVPGPPLTVTTGGPLTINLRNDLPEPTSIVINGQTATELNAMRPTWTDGLTGNRTSVTQRVRSFTHEVASGQTGTYTWAVFKPGTYLYQTGTHPAKQVQMGLYGAATAEYAPADVPHTSDVVALFSEIDPALHDAVRDGTYGIPPFTSTIDYKPKYFLINGKPFGSGQEILNALTPAAAGDTILLRLLNAGLDNREVVVQGQTLTLYAEDGYLLPFVFQHNGLLLPAGKTLDATITPTANGYLPVFDRRLGLSNAASSPGGMLAYLQVGAAGPALTVAKNPVAGGTVTAVSAPGGINCGLVCGPQSYLTGTEILLKATPAAGFAFNGPASWTGCSSTVGNDCLVAITADTTVTADFRQITAVKVLAPVAGETIPGGTDFTISWEAPAAAVKFNLAFSINGGLTWRRIANGVTGDSYTWHVPVLSKDRANCRVRVIGLRANGTVVGRNRSGRFTIDSPIFPAPAP